MLAKSNIVTYENVQWQSETLKTLSHKAKWTTRPAQLLWMGWSYLCPLLLMNPSCRLYKYTRTKRFLDHCSILLYKRDNDNLKSSWTKDFHHPYSLTKAILQSVHAKSVSISTHRWTIKRNQKCNLLRRMNDSHCPVLWDIALSVCRDGNEQIRPHQDRASLIHRYNDMLMKQKTVAWLIIITNW